MSNYLPPGLPDPNDYEDLDEDLDEDDFSDAPDPLEDWEDEDTEVGEESADSVWPEDYPTSDNLNKYE